MFIHITRTKYFFLGDSWVLNDNHPEIPRLISSSIKNSTALAWQCSLRRDFGLTSSSSSSFPSSSSSCSCYFPVNFPSFISTFRVSGTLQLHEARQEVCYEVQNCSAGVRPSYFRHACVRTSICSSHLQFFQFYLKLAQSFLFVRAECLTFSFVGLKKKFCAQLVEEEQRIEEEKYRSKQLKTTQNHASLLLQQRLYSYSHCSVCLQEEGCISCSQEKRNAKD